MEACKFVGTSLEKSQLKSWLWKAEWKDVGAEEDREKISLRPVDGSWNEDNGNAIASTRQKWF